MTMIPEERVVLRALHGEYSAFAGARPRCSWDGQHWPCQVILLLDDLDAAEVQNAALRAKLDEFAVKLGRKVEG